MSRSDILDYYWRELSYLREMGGRFAQSHPKVAGQLELSEAESPDPQIERLIESFAFLTGRIQHSVDHDFSLLAGQLLETLHPHYTLPVPSMSVAEFVADPELGKLTSGYEVPAHTPLFVDAERSRRGGIRVCRFRTAYDTTLWPIEVTEACFESRDKYEFLDAERYSRVASTLRLRIEAVDEPLDALSLERLRFYLYGQPLQVTSLYELLFADALGVVLLPDHGTRRDLPASAIRPVGFGLEEEVLPYPLRSEPAYRLLQEYFVFPEKFHFFDLSGLGGTAAEGALDLIFLLGREPGAQLRLLPSTFRLGCTPIINLFPKTTEPVRVDHRQSEYRLVPDVRNETTTEIHSLVRVAGSSDLSEDTKVYAPFFSFEHESLSGDRRAFWYTRRAPTVRRDMGGTDLMLSFVDLDFDPCAPPTEAVHARALCTNRDLAEQIPAGQELECEAEGLPVSRVTCLHSPTASLRSGLSGEVLWKVVSHLSLNHLSLEDGDVGLKALREILKLYSSEESESSQQQILGVRAVSRQSVVRRTGKDAWRGFCRGSEITVELDEENYQGTNAFLLGAVLSHFFALWSSTNHFTQLVLKSRQREGEWKRWPPMVGERKLL